MRQRLMNDATTVPRFPLDYTGSAPPPRGTGMPSFFATFICISAASISEYRWAISLSDLDREMAFSNICTEPSMSPLQTHITFTSKACIQRSMRKNSKKSGATVWYSELSTITYCKIPLKGKKSIINYATGPLETDPLLRGRPRSFKCPAQINCETNPDNTNRICHLKSPCPQKLWGKL